MDPGLGPTDGEMAQLVELLEERGLIEVYLDDHGRETYRLTDEGVRVGTVLALVDDGGEIEDETTSAGLDPDPTERPWAASPSG